MNPNLVQVSEIKIRVGQKEVAFTPDELRELRDLLNEMLGQPNPNVGPGYQPLWIDPNQEPWPNQITCEWGMLHQSCNLVINI